MVPGQNSLDWQGSANGIFLNPRWPRADFEALEKLARESTDKLQLQSHLWVSTSGSSSDQISQIKLVALSKQAFLNSAAAVNRHLKSTSSDVWAQVLPLFHVGGIGIEARAYLSGARVVQGLRDFKWEPEHFLQVLEEQKVTLSALVPTQVYDLVRLQKRSPTYLRAIVVGGGALHEGLYIQARALGWPLLPSYGMTETCSQIATASLESLSVRQYPSIPLLDHAEARTDASGFLQIRASSLLTAYAQAQRGVWDPKQNGWFTAEDQGEVQNGSLRIHGRTQDFIKIGGESTSLSRLRAILETTVMEAAPAWQHDLALLDWPSERLGREVHMVFSSKVPASERDRLRSTYDSKVLPFERIRAYHEVPVLPRSDLGKILYAELRRGLENSGKGN